MENSIYEREIDLKDLFFYIVYRWRSVILCALILGILLGGYKLARGAGAGVPQEVSEEVTEEYEEKVAEYERRKIALETSIENLKIDIKSEEEYLAESILMRVDPYNIPMARADVFVRLDNPLEEKDQQNVNLTYGLVGLYRSIILEGIDWSKIETLAGGTKAKYLKELVKAEISGSGSAVAVTVYFEDQETAVSILDAILEQVQEQSQDTMQDIEKHTVTILNKNVGTTIDSNVADDQKKKRDSLTAHDTSLSDWEKLLDGLDEPTEPAGAVGVPKMQILKGGVKYAILGVVVGAFLMAGLWIAIYLLSGKVFNETDVKDRFGIDILGVFTITGKKRFLSVIDQWLRKMDGRYELLPDEEVVERAVLQMQSGDSVIGKVLVTGSVSEEKLQHVKTLLAQHMKEVEFIVGTDMNRSTGTVHLATKCDSVVLVEKRGGSAYKRIQKEKEMIDALKKPIIGCLLY